MERKGSFARVERSIERGGSPRYIASKFYRISPVVEPDHEKCMASSRSLVEFEHNFNVDASLGGRESTRSIRKGEVSSI